MSESSEPLRAPRRLVPDPPEAAEGWRAADVPDSERVDDAFIAADVDDPETPVKVYEPLAPEDDRLFPSVPLQPEGGEG